MIDLKTAVLLKTTELTWRLTIALFAHSEEGYFIVMLDDQHHVMSSLTNEKIYDLDSAMELFGKYSAYWK